MKNIHVPKKIETVPIDQFFPDDRPFYMQLLMPQANSNFDYMYAVVIVAA